MQPDRIRRRLGSIAFIGNHLPRKCGIATFTTDLADAVREEVEGRHRVFVIAMNDRPEAYAYPPQVEFEVDKTHQADYVKAADFINVNQARVVCMQHEYGIFGGSDGRHVLLTLRDMRAPLVTTLHTILYQPSAGQKMVMDEILRRSARIVVMSNKGVGFLKKVYGVPDEKIEFIHHGIPDIEFGPTEPYKEALGVAGRRVILTFGLLSANKGIEYMIEGLRTIVDKHPDVVYLVLGATHPEVRKRTGDEYRHNLQRQVRNLGLEDHVLFLDRFVELSELCDFLCAADVYVTPYLNREQITSGTLCYAMGAGAAIVSTPYWYAEELLAEGRGRLVPFRDGAALAEAVMYWLDNESELQRIRRKAYEFTRCMVWKDVAGEYLRVFDEVAQPRPAAVVPRAAKPAVAAKEVPKPKLKHLVRLTDSTGMLQHAKYLVPDPTHGYTTDDNARGLVVAAKFNQLYGSDEALSLLGRYLSFHKYMQIDDGRFHNLLGYDRRFLDTVGTDDCFGRALWGLGCAVACAPDEYWPVAKEMFDISTKHFDSFNLRGAAYAMRGLHSYLQRFPQADDLKNWARTLAVKIVEQYSRHYAPDWRWFEDIIAYDNAVVPHALYLAYSLTGQKEFLEIAEESLGFLVEECRCYNHFSLVGCNGWYKRGGEKAPFDQQPIDACSLVEALGAAYRTTGRDEYLADMQRAFDWFFGGNDLGLPLYDFDSGGCADGLTPVGPNRNRGAESTVSCLLAMLDMIEMSALLEPSKKEETAVGERESRLDSAPRLRA